jgi:sulfatase maturation enzyme AslB (radical SAM superfamily)
VCLYKYRVYKFCNSPWTTISIKGNGDVGLCLCPAWHKKGVIGNLNEQSLGELFSSAWMTDFRQTIIDQSFKYCRQDTCGKIWNLDQVENFDHVVQYPGLPTTIYLQSLDNNCNLTCASCRNVNIYSKEVKPQAEKILNQLIEEYRGFSKSVMVCGDGSGDVFASTTYLNFLNNPNLPKCFKFAVNTNGNLLIKNLDMLERLKNQFSAVCVSFDASRPNTYKKIRGGNFDIVKKGVEELIKLGIPVTTQFIVQQGNYQEVLEYLHMAQDLGATFIGLQTLRRWNHMTNEWWAINTIENNPHVDYAWLIPALKEFKSATNTGLDGGLETLMAQYRPTVSDQGI